MQMLLLTSLSLHSPASSGVSVRFPVLLQTRMGALHPDLDDFQSRYGHCSVFQYFKFLKAGIFGNSLICHSAHATWQDESIGRNPATGRERPTIIIGPGREAAGALASSCKLHAEPQTRLMD